MREHLFPVIIPIVLLIFNLIVLGYSISLRRSRLYEGNQVKTFLGLLWWLCLIELLYFFWVGMDGVNELLSAEQFWQTALYTVLVLVFVFAQAYSFSSLLARVVNQTKSRFGKIWRVVGGALIGFGLLVFYEVIFEPDTENLNVVVAVITQILGQIPAGIFFAKRMKKSVQSQKHLFVVVYPVAAGCTVSLLLGSVFVFIASMVLGLLLVGLFARESSRTVAPKLTQKEIEEEEENAEKKEEEYQEYRRELERQYALTMHRHHGMSREEYERELDRINHEVY